MAAMTPQEKQRLSRQNDTGLAASAIRLRAARKVAGLGQIEMAEECRVSNKVLSNAENGLTYPSREILTTLWRGYRIDFNFMINGDFSQLPADIQERLFVALADANSEWDRREHLNRSRNARRHGRSQTLPSRT